MQRSLPKYYQNYEFPFPFVSMRVNFIFASVLNILLAVKSVTGQIFIFQTMLEFKSLTN